MIMRGQFTTEKGTTLHYNMSYDLGGHNGYRETKRGYRLFISRHPNTWAMHEGLDGDKGAVNVFMHEVKRKSQRQADIACDMVTPEFLQGIADRYGI